MPHHCEVHKQDRRHYPTVHFLSEYHLSEHFSSNCCYTTISEYVQAYPQADFMEYSEFILSFWDDVFCDFYQSVEGIISASKEDLVLCPGLGPQKVS